MNTGVPTKPEDEGHHHHRRDGVGEDHADRDRDEQDLRTDQDPAGVEAINQDPGDRRTDQRGETEGGHDRGDFAGGRLQLEGGLAPDPDEEGGLTTDPGDEAGGDDPDDVTICPHGGHATAGGGQIRLE